MTHSTLLRHPRRQPRADEQLLLGPSTTSGPAERPRGVEPARLGCKPGTSRIVVDELTAAAKAEAARLPIVAIQTELGPDPLSAEPVPLKNWADVLHGAEANVLRQLSRLTVGTTAALVRDLDDTLAPVMAAHRAVYDDAGIEPVDPAELRRCFVALSVATEDAYADFAAEWVVAGVTIR
jgi:hypothetical protein